MPDSAHGGGGRVAVLACAPSLLVSLERSREGDLREIHLHPGGQGFWVARMARILGAEVTLVGPFAGEPGDALVSLIEREGLTVAAVDGDGPNGVSISEEREGEEPSLAHLPAPRLDRHAMDRLATRLLAEGLDADVTVLTGASEGILDPARLSHLAHDLHAVGGKVVADLSGAAMQCALEGGLDLLKVSHEDLIEAGGAEGDDPTSIVAAIDRLRDAGAAQVLVSRAERPAIAWDGERHLELSAAAFTPVNYRGAGDSMTGAAAAALAAGHPIREGLALAVAAGALNVTRHGLGTGDDVAIRRLASEIGVSPVAL
jgi:1-phosphofructokinase